MPPKRKPEPTTPADAYKAIIDQLVNETSHGLSERLVRGSGIYSKAPSEEAANAFVRSLTPEQRNLLADMLRHERTGAIHDVLAVLSWWLSCGGVGLTFHGQPMPFELSDMGLHGDYVGRLDGWQWPKDEPPG
jgi:hypothetical protein